MRSGAAALLFILVTGCASSSYRDAIEDLAEFTPLVGTPQVRFTPGAEEFARRVAAALPAAVSAVETGHYRRFRTAPEIYVCDSDACFHRFVSPRYNFTAAVVYDNRLLLAPRLFDREPERLAPILTHELSHLHLGQVRGHYTPSIPIWFHEGFASLVAEGGGADLASDADAWRAVDDGKHFLPDEQHLPWERKWAGTWSLPTSVFYRQAYVYLRDLRARDEAAFRTLLDSLYQGEDFDAAFARAMHANPNRSVRAYFNRLQCAQERSRKVDCAATMAQPE
jgi:hypothetical protein